MNPEKDWKAKLEKAHFLKVQSDRITVWAGKYLHLVKSRKEACYFQLVLVQSPDKIQWDLTDNNSQCKLAKKFEKNFVNSLANNIGSFNTFSSSCFLNFHEN